MTSHHVSDEKKEVVKKIVDLISNNEIVGAVNMENLPAPPLQKMKEQLRDKVTIFMAKRRLIKIAIEQTKDKKKGIEQLEPYLLGMPALIFTNENPFKLYKTLQKSKSPAPAKPGQISPKDIVIPAGPTSFAPGPIIGELGALGIKTGVENGKVAVKEDSVVVKEGEEIKPKVAELLIRFGIEPMEVGLDLVATYEKGIIFDKKVLHIDEDEFSANLSNAARWAFNLAVFSGYTTKETIKPMIAKAFREAKAIGLSQNIIDQGVIEDLIGKAERGMLGLKSSANIEVSEKAAKPEEKPAESPKEEKKPEPKEEPKPAEPKPEEKKAEPPKEEKKEPPKPAEPKPEEKAVEKKPETAPAEKKETPVEEKKGQPVVEKKGQPVEEKKSAPVVEKEKTEIQATQFPKKGTELKQVKKDAEEAKKEIDKEAKQEEKKHPEQAPKIEKAAEELKKEVDKEEKNVEKAIKVEDKVAKMVEETKKRSEGKEPTADSILKEVSESPKPKAGDVPTIQELAKNKGKAASKDHIPSAHELAQQKEKKNEENKDVENLAKELVKKGTLRR